MLDSGLPWPQTLCVSVLVDGRTGRAAQSVGLRTVACWDCGFESRQEHGRLSLASVVCCQVEISGTMLPTMGW